MMASNSFFRFVPVRLCITLFCIAFTMLTACEGGLQSGNVKEGQEIFNTQINSQRGPLPACAKCHAVVEGQKSETGLGTNFHDIATRATKEVPGQSAEDYLRTSIVDPDAHLAGGFQDGLMSRDYKKLITAQQIEDLVAYMLTLK
jgi:cytochrome c553